MKQMGLTRTPPPDASFPAAVNEDTQCAVQAGLALRTLSHFAKNLLQMVGGAAEVADIAIQKNDRERLQQSWNLFLPNYDRLKRWTMDITEYGKKRPLSPVLLDLAQTFRQAIASLPPLLRPQAEMLRLVAPPKLPNAKLDSEQIRRMFCHLLIHFLDIEQPDTLEIEFRYLPEASEFEIELSVPLPAISSDDLSLISDPQSIFQPREYKNCRFRSGLDLPLALRIIEAHHGRIEFEPAPHPGTIRFRILLPHTPA